MICEYPQGNLFYHHNELVLSPRLTLMNYNNPDYVVLENVKASIENIFPSPTNPWEILISNVSSLETTFYKDGAKYKKFSNPFLRWYSPDKLFSCNLFNNTFEVISLDDEVLFYIQGIPSSHSPLYACGIKNILYIVTKENDTVYIYRSGDGKTCYGVKYGPPPNHVFHTDQALYFDWTLIDLTSVFENQKTIVIDYCDSFDLLWEI